MSYRRLSTSIILNRGSIYLRQPLTVWYTDTFLIDIPLFIDYLLQLRFMNVDIRHCRDSRVKVNREGSFFDSSIHLYRSINCLGEMINMLWLSNTLPHDLTRRQNTAGSVWIHTKHPVEIEFLIRGKPVHRRIWRIDTLDRLSLSSINGIFFHLYHWMLSQNDDLQDFETGNTSYEK